MENFPYLFAAYTITVIVLLAYVFSLHQRQGRLRQELEDMKATLREKAEKET